MGNNKPNTKEVLAYVGAALVVYFWLSWHVFTNAIEPKPVPNWVQPTAITLKRVSDLPAAQSSPVAFPNIKCSLSEYRYNSDSNMYTGCLSDSAYGLFDIDTQSLVFNGSDEALPVLQFAAHQSLVPWPGAEFLSVDPAPYGGSNLTLYTNPLGVMSDKRNLLLQLTAKQLNQPPNLSLKDKKGQRLAVNAQTLTFSDNGAWMVVESLDQSFIRMNLSTLEIKPFTSNYIYNGNVNQPSHIAISDSGRYVMIFNNPAGQFRVYDLSNCPINSNNLEPEYCLYHDYLDFVKKQVSGVVSIKNISYINENFISFEIISSKSENSGIYELAPTDGIDNLMDYLGLGDSYTSGEGAFNYRSGTDSSDNMCHLSANSYPLLIARDLFSNRAGNSVACSGAVINDIGASEDTYKGQVKDVLDFAHLKSDQPLLLGSVMTNYMPGYVAQQRFLGQYIPKYVTVSIGGNDVGFGDLLESCVMPKVSLHASDNDCFNSYEDRQEIIQLIDRKVNLWTKLFKNLKQKSPNTTVIALGYPQVADDKGNCARNVNLSKSEIEFSIEVINYINASIQKSANNAGVSYLDISDALDGRKLCQASSYNVAVNGLTAGRDGGIFGIDILGKESYHPNILGHQLIEQTILNKSKNFTIYATKSTSPDNSNLLKAPKSGRQINNREPVKFSDKKLTRGVSAKVSVKAKPTGTKPSTSYKVVLGSSANPSIGTVTSNQDGDINSSIIIPVGAATGGQNLHIIGEGNGGAALDITQPVYIPVSDTDYDGDGLDNNHDSCPNAINSGQDADQDYIDDICDPLIGGNSSSQQPGSKTDTGNQLTVSSKISSSGTTPTSGPGSDRVASTASQQQPATQLKTSNKPTFNEVSSSVKESNNTKSGFDTPKNATSLTFWLWFVAACWVLIFLFLYLRERDRQNTKYQLAR